MTKTRYIFKSYIFLNSSYYGSHFSSWDEKLRAERRKSSSGPKYICIQDWSSGKPVPRTPLKATMQLDRGGFLESSDSQRSNYLGDTQPRLHYHKTGINQMTSTSTNSLLSLWILDWRSSSWNEEQRFGGRRKGRGDTDALGLCQLEPSYTDKKKMAKVGFKLKVLLGF